MTDNSKRADTSAAPSCCTSWLHIAFWKKPLHFLAQEQGHGHHHVQEADGDDSSHSSHHLERTLELFDLIMIGIGGTVGAGVFATAGLIANVYAGPAAILSWLIAGVGCILSGLSFMELSCLIPSAGSSYAYAYHALGEFPAMCAGFLLTLEYGVSSAGGARSWSDKFTNWLLTEWGIKGPDWLKPKDSTIDLYAGFLMAICVSVVLCGIQAGKRLVNIVTMTKISVVVFIIVCGFLHFDSQNVTPFVPTSHVSESGRTSFGWPGVFMGASASFFGYIGYDEVCCLAGEAKNPTHTIPRAVIGTIVGAAVLSTLATMALVGMQSYVSIDTEESFGKAFESVGWPLASTIVSTGEVFTMPITTLIGFMAQPRVQYAMAKDGLLPEVFAQVDSKGTLFFGTLLCGIAMILIAVFIPFKILWDFISLGILVAFNITNTSLLLVRAEALTVKAQTTHRYLLVAFLFTSFAAAFYWQTSVIAPTVPSDVGSTSYVQQHLHHWGVSMASMLSIITIAIIIGLKYVERMTAVELLHPAKTRNHKASVEEEEEDSHTEDDSIPSLSVRTSVQRVISYEDGLNCIEKEQDDEEEDNNGKPETFRAPWVPFTPCIAIFFNWFLFAQMEASSVALIVLWLLLALAIYVSYSMHHSLAQQQVVYHRVNC